jgi:hypothetical protein
VEVAMAYAFSFWRRVSALLVLRKKAHGHGHLPLFFSRELWRWSWPMPSSSREEEDCPSSPKKEGVMAMVIFFLVSVESCGGGHGIFSRDEKVCPSYS